MKQSGSSQRRQFLKNSIGILGAACLLGVTANAEEQRRRKKPEGGDAKGGGDLALPLVEAAKDPMAQSTSYVSNKADMKKAELKTERQGVKFEGQSCANCTLYTAVGKKDGKDVGKCTLFAGKLVAGAGWCSSWAKKA